MRATASFDLDSFDGDPPYWEEGAIRHQRVRIAKTFRGDIEARGSVEMLGAQATGGAGYVALERITGTDQGRTGGLSVLHIGTMVGDAPCARWRIVPVAG